MAVDEVVGDDAHADGPLVLAEAPEVAVDPALDGDPDGGVHQHRQHHHRAPGIGWLLLVPGVCIAIVPLRPLGSGAAVSDRSANVVAEGRPVRRPMVPR